MPESKKPGLDHVQDTMRIVCASMLVLGTTWVHAEPVGEPQTCTYESYNWNVRLNRAVNNHIVSHPYSELSPEEVDPQTRCTVCREDQKLVQVGSLKPFLVCSRMADAVQSTLEHLLKKGEPILEVTAYRPGRTRNPVDAEGNRIGFSNHAYGAAIDINRSKNGLYDNCMQFGSACRLIQGGAWQPGRPGVLHSDSPIVRGMLRAGLKWGGEIAGNQKDFMHFSVTGY